MSFLENCFTNTQQVGNHPFFGIIRNCGKSSAQIRLLDQAADMVGQHLDGGAVFTAIGDDDIGVALAGLHKSLVHGLDGGAVLGDDSMLPE